MLNNDKESMYNERDWMGVFVVQYIIDMLKFSVVYLKNCYEHIVQHGFAFKLEYVNYIFIVTLVCFNWKSYIY